MFITVITYIYADVVNQQENWVYWLMIAGLEAQEKKNKYDNFNNIVYPEEYWSTLPRNQSTRQEKVWRGNLVYPSGVFRGGKCTTRQRKHGKMG